VEKSVGGVRGEERREGWEIAKREGAARGGETEVERAKRERLGGWKGGEGVGVREGGGGKGGGSEG